MSNSLPSQANLEHLKAQASDLLNAHRANDANATQRLQALFPDVTEFALHHAQLTVAREYGFDSWPAMKASLEDSALQQFVKAATDGRLEQADQWLVREPSLRNQPAVRLMLGEAIEDLTAPVPPLDRVPLLYIAFSKYASRAQNRAGLLALAEKCLDAGADPNAHWFVDEWKETALYGSAGHNNFPELTKLLLDRGAEPTDPEALYHSTEFADGECLRLLLEAGSDPEGKNALPRSLDFDHPICTELLLKHGVLPTDSMCIHHAVWRGRTLPTIKVLVEHGLDPSVVAPMFNVNALDVAAMTGNFATLEWLKEQGHVLTEPKLEPVWRSLWEGNPVPGDFPAVMHLALFPAVAKGNVRAIRAMVASGFRVDTPEPFNGGFPIHHACFHGQPESLQALFDLGASWDVTDRQYNGHPLGWLLVGSEHTDRPNDYVRCAEILVANGHAFKTAEKEGSNPFWTGHPMIHAYFRSLGAIE
jgi:ankyrin repeat protein